MVARYHWISLLALVVLCQILMLLPGSLNLWIEPELAENRVLAPAPELPREFGAVDQFGRAFDAYVKDNFPSRKHLIGALNYARYRLGYSGSSRVIVGKKGWLFYDNGSHLAQVRNSTLDDAAVLSWVGELNRRTENLRKRKVEYVVFSAPVKEGIYIEHVPERWLDRQGGGASDADVLKLVSGRTGSGALLDVKGPLIQKKKEGVRVYSPFDTHWTGDGAYIAYETLLSHLSARGVPVNAFPLSFFTPVHLEQRKRPQDMAYMLGIASFVEQNFSVYGLPEGSQSPSIHYLGESRDWTADRVIDTGAQGPVLLYTGDSFSVALLPFLEASFSRIIFSHHQNGFHRDDLVSKFSPDVVVLEVIESGFRHAMSR